MECRGSCWIYIYIHIEKDTAYIIDCGPESSEDKIKTPKPMCEAISDCLTLHGIPDVSIQFHKLVKKTKVIEGEETEIPFRYAVQSTSQACAFVPKELSDTEVAEGNLNRQMLGAIFHGKYELLPCKYGKVLWEHAFHNATPPILKLLRPKLWLACRTKLEAGNSYMLE